jgi:hypothetical protein
MLMDPLFESRPKVFNGVQIRTLRRPFKYRYAIIFDPFWDLFSCVGTGVILHERHTRLSCSRDLFAENREIGGVSWLL